MPPRRVRLQDEGALEAYARCVAGSVGTLSIQILGIPEARDFAVGLGRPLQIVNILRDVEEDAALERIYMPLSRLAQLGLQDGPARALVGDGRFARACPPLAEQARAGFTAADAALARLDRTKLKPAILMTEGDRRILDRLQARGCGGAHPKLRLTATDRLQLLTLEMRVA